MFDVLDEVDMDPVVLKMPSAMEERTFVGLLRPCLESCRRQTFVADAYALHLCLRDGRCLESDEQTGEHSTHRIARFGIPFVS